MSPWSASILMLCVTHTHKRIQENAFHKTHLNIERNHGIAYKTQYVDVLNNNYSRAVCDYA